MPIVFGIDIGTSSVKCLALNTDPPPPGWAGVRGRGDTTMSQSQSPPPQTSPLNGAGNGIIAFAQQAYPTHQPHEGWSEQDPEDYLRTLEHVVRRCVEACLYLGWRREDIRAIALSTQADTLIIADEAGTPLRPAITWMDTRGGSEFRDLLEANGQAWWYSRLGQPLSVYSSACKLLWLRRHEPELMARRPRIAFVPDFVARRLTGRWATDVPSASWSPFCDPVRRYPAEQVMQVLDVEPAQVSEPVGSGLPIGPLLPEMADRLGLSHDTVLVAGAFDQTAAAFGAGADAGSTGVLSCGTAWVLYSVAASPPTDPEHPLCVCCHIATDEWGVVLPFTGGSAYDWLTRVTKGGSQASDAAPLIFVPHLYGGLSPDWQSASKGSLLGLTLAHTAEDIRLALMRGMAFETRRNVEAAQPYAGKPQAVRMVGGATRSDIWPQMIADALGCVVEVPSVREAACYGAAMLAAGRESAIAPDADVVFAPDPDESSRTDALYARYLDAYRLLCGHYANDADA